MCQGIWFILGCLVFRVGCLGSRDQGLELVFSDRDCAFRDVCLGIGVRELGVWECV